MQPIEDRIKQSEYTPEDKEKLETSNINQILDILGDKFNLIKEIDINSFLQRLFKCKFNAREIFIGFNENKKVNLMMGLMLPHERDTNIKLNYRSYF